MYDKEIRSFQFVSKFLLGNVSRSQKFCHILKGPCYLFGEVAVSEIDFVHTLLMYSRCTHAFFTHLVRELMNNVLNTCNLFYS